MDHGDPWRPLSHQLWVVNHFASQRRVMEASPSMWSKLTFDFKAAEAEIRRVQVLDADELTYSLEGDAVSVPVEAVADLQLAASRESTDPLLPMSRLSERRVPAPAAAANVEAETRGAAGAEQPAQGGAAGERSLRARLSVSGQPLVRGGYVGMPCAGCRKPFGQRALSSSITPGGVGMIHNLRGCLDLARRRMEAEAAAAVVSGGGTTAGDQLAADALHCVVIEPDAEVTETTSEWAPVRSGCAQRKAQFRERIGEKRRGRVRRCLAGRCGVTEEHPMVCLGRVDGWPCPSYLH